MGDIVTHNIFGRLALNKLVIDAPNFEIDDNYFDIGNMGPDIFYYDIFRGENSVIKYGDLLQTNVDVGEMFNIALDIIREGGNDNKLISFWIGLVCHYQLDKYLHPYVEHCINERQKIINDTNLNLHGLIENELDVLLYERIRRKKIGCLNVKIYKVRKEAKEGIALIWQEIIMRLFAKDISLKRLKSAISVVPKLTRLQIFMPQLTYKVAKWITEVFQLSYKISYKIKHDVNDESILNLKNNAWFDPRMPNEISTASVFDIIKYSLDKSYSMINDYLRDTTNYTVKTDSRDFDKGFMKID